MKYVSTSQDREAFKILTSVQICETADLLQKWYNNKIVKCVSTKKYVMLDII